VWQEQIFAMKNMFRFFVILMVPIFLLTSCKDDPADPTISDFETLTQYMYNNNLDLNNILDGWVKPATGVNVDQTDFSVPDYYVLDIRGEEDFNQGHIKDAVNTSLVNILEAADGANGKPVLVVCYTGQTAARATAALRMMGIEAYSMKWGMSGWNNNLAAKWNSNAGDFSSPNWVNDGEPVANTTFAEPTFTTGEVDAADMLEARVRYMLTKPWTVSKDVVLANPENFFINNYWPIESWDEYGHVKDAYRINEDLGLAGVKFLDPDAEIVIYCYTGQTSGMVTAWLDVLGYNTKSMMFGANTIVHSKLVASDVGGGKKKSWHGEGSASECNFGYYDIDGTFYGPN
jgi:rhodanese-related sulfurtransferase